MSSLVFHSWLYSYATDRHGATIDRFTTYSIHGSSDEVFHFPKILGIQSAHITCCYVEQASSKLSCCQEQPLFQKEACNWNMLVKHSIRGHEFEKDKVFCSIHSKVGVLHALEWEDGNQNKSLPF